MKIRYGLFIILVVVVLFITYQYNREGFETIQRTCRTEQTSTLPEKALEIGAKCDNSKEYLSTYSYDKTKGFFTYTCCPVLQGEKGPDGPKGEDGKDGAKGPTGPTGPIGPIGSTGDKGPSGQPGLAGPRGEKGDTGDIGPAGLAGPKGDPAVLGPKDTDGIPINIGPTGPVGDMGPPGPAGDAGRAGKNSYKQDENDLILNDIDYNDEDAPYVSDIAKRTINLVALQRNARNMLSSLSDSSTYNKTCSMTPALAQGNEFNK